MMTVVSPPRPPKNFFGAHGDFVMRGMYVAFLVYTLLVGGRDRAALATLVLATSAISSISA